MTIHKSEAPRFDSDAIDAIFQQIDCCHLPGGVVGIAIAGRAVYRRGFGLANMNVPQVLASTTKLRVASVTKQITCLAYLLLCESANVRLDDPIGRFIPELNPASRQVTMRQLMSHTSGIRDVYLLFSLFNDPYVRNRQVAQSVSSDDLLRWYRDIDDVDALPNTTWIYNNGGYLLLTAAIERISDQSLADFLRRFILDPIGMNDTFLELSDDRYGSNRGSQHVVSQDGGYETLNWGLDNYSGGGALVSTVDDLLRWLAHMANPIACRPDVLALMQEPQKLGNGFDTGYGLGLHIGSFNGYRFFSHTGNALGGSAEVITVPDLGLDIAVLVNRQDIWCSAFTKRILEACVPERGGMPKRREVKSYAEGIFLSPTSGVVIQLSAGIHPHMESGSRQIVCIDGRDMPFLEDSDGVLQCDDGFEKGRLSVTLTGGGGRPDSILLSDFGHTDRLIRLPPSSAVDPSALIGRYRAASIQTEGTVVNGESGLQWHTVGPFGTVLYELRHIGNMIFRAIPPSDSKVGFLGGMLTFEISWQTLRFSCCRTRSLVFERIR